MAHGQFLPQAYAPRHLVMMRSFAVCCALCMKILGLSHGTDALTLASLSDRRGGDGHNGRGNVM